MSVAPHVLYIFVLTTVQDSTLARYAVNGPIKLWPTLMQLLTILNYLCHHFLLCVRPTSDHAIKYLITFSQTELWHHISLFTNISPVSVLYLLLWQVLWELEKYWMRCVYCF